MDFLQPCSSALNVKSRADSPGGLSHCHPLFRLKHKRLKPFGESGSVTGWHD
jgi:hypothetical protein